MFSLRLDDELAARFDAAAAPHGGRSARLRQLVVSAAGSSAAEPILPVGGRRDATRLMVRLAPREARHVADQAAALAMPRAGWVAALVRNHACGAPRLARSDELALLAIHGEVRRIGVNVNQIARALNTAVMEGRVLDTELGAVADLGRELRGHMAGLGEAFAGNLAYWAVEL